MTDEKNHGSSDHPEDNPGDNLESLDDLNLGEVSLGESGLTLPIEGFGSGFDDGTGQGLISNGLAAGESGAGATSADLDGTGGPLRDADGEQVVPPRPITTEDMAELAAVEAELDQRWPETKIDPTLERVQLLMDLLGNPESAFPVIHVAGTNGKTSTVRMIESLLRAFHRRTGRTTSPHLQIVTERIAIDGEPMHPQDYIATWREIKPYVEMVDAKSAEQGGPQMSKFEVLVAMAYASFADAPVDVAVVETGMGGRWDATNVVNADVAVITPIGLDHTDYLGDTIEQIAGEKAGIIKSRWDADDLLTPPDNVTVIAEQDPDAMRVVLAEAVDKDSAVARAGVEFGVVDAQIAVGGQQVTLKGLGGTYGDIFLPLSGEHQARNAAVALAAVEAFFGAGSGRQLDADTVREGFAQVTSPGRLERVRSAPSVFIDASHNPHGANALAAAVARDFSFRRLVGVVGVLGDKDARGILAVLEAILDEVVVTRTQSPRALDEETLAEYARDAFGEERVHVATNLPGAVEMAIELAEDDGDEGMVSGAGVLITGSVVTAGEARTLFGKQPS
ncbi:folylpolyglutamate synthase/dihydrofolate synthase family protein [uncultured Corynebacterium sp.]|uniref:bifunctional tetrahydrofolate synthase/dihydrofolate synthase n=1 Tax=uncultured Corynebacterium sp. TaxID=159447 RepID=UPI0025E300A0|nr:folylpolyglutamate synthase/dihydrofolate synthase family protein [uncultured Corynebacterium sp.]